MNQKINIKSRRLDKDFEVEVYQKDDVLIVRHTSLENIYWGLEDKVRPEMTVDTVDLARLPGIPPMFAVKCLLKDPATGCVFEQFGEMLCSNWQAASKITQDFPLTICKNQAFDRAFVRFLQFDISGFKAIALYSDSEMDIPSGDQVFLGNIDDSHENTSTGIRTPEQPQSGVDVWSGMSAEQTMEAYGYQEIQEAPEATREGQTPSPFPWGPATNRTPAANGIPDTLQMPDEYAMGSQTNRLKTLSVYEVGFDVNSGKAVVVTDAGTATFNPFDAVWESSEFDLLGIDIDALYQTASGIIGKDLRSYNGPSLP